MNTTQESENNMNAIEKGAENILEPFKEFIKDQKTTSILLVMCTAVALFLANSSSAELYEKLLHTPFGLTLGDASFQMSLRHWINDGLMALFFFLLGVEMKREVLTGTISKRERFVPIAFAAVGGMVFPALIFLLFNSNTPYEQGWGITMATDAAFAIGVLALLGKRVPTGAFVFLTALAILDDLGAILVIAFFYSDSISFYYLGIGLFILLILAACNIIGTRRSSVYFILGVLLWVALLNSGIHATIAGVLVAAFVPARPKHDPKWFLRQASTLIDRFKSLEAEREANDPILGEEKQHLVVEEMQNTAEAAATPLRQWENSIEHPVALIIMPIFALANAGVAIDLEIISQQWSNSLTLGIFFGLILGKGLGIPLLTWLALKLKLGSLPDGVSMKHIMGLGMLGAIGFTMSIFITGLSFGDTSDSINIAKRGILVASFTAGVGGYLWLRFTAADN